MLPQREGTWHLVSSVKAGIKCHPASDLGMSGTGSSGVTDNEAPGGCEVASQRPVGDCMEGKKPWLIML